MKKLFIIYILFCFPLFVYSNNPSIKVKLQTNKDIYYDEWNDLSAVQNNSLVIIENGKETDIFTTKSAEIIEILSVSNNTIKIRTKENKAFSPGPSAPYWSDVIIVFSYKNQKLNEIITYPEDQGSQSGPNIKLLKAKIENNKSIFSYSYQQYGDSKYAGFGIINFELDKIKDGYWYVSKYKCDVKGYFHVADEENDIWVPSENGEKIVESNISKMAFFDLFPVYKNVIIYNTAIVDNICRVYENLRLRENENTSSSIIKTMKTGEYVKILKVSKKEIIDEIPGNWCYVEIIEPQDKEDITEDIKTTGIKGWCFSGYLK